VHVVIAYCNVGSVVVTFYFELIIMIRYKMSLITIIICHCRNYSICYISCFWCLKICLMIFFFQMKFCLSSDYPSTAMPTFSLRQENTFLNDSSIWMVSGSLHNNLLKLFQRASCWHMFRTLNSFKITKIFQTKSGKRRNKHMYRIYRASYVYWK
jgi:hypothetical protein